MNRLFNFRVIVAGLLLSGAILSCARPEGNTPRPDALAADSPANTAYLIENDWIQLANGRAEWQAAPDSASKIRVALSGETSFCDLNKDGTEDAVIFLTYQSGGSGTFYYLGAALHEKGNYIGTNGLLLGDRISSPFAKVQNGLISVEYLDRRQGEPMTTAPGVLQTRYFILNDSRLLEIKLETEERIFQGWLTIGHEVRSFLPCDGKAELWLLGKSPALGDIISAFNEKTAGLSPYALVFAILSGRHAAPPDTGFGANYKDAFFASQLVRIWPQGNCRSDFILLESPLPGAHIASPLTLKGRARGTWFFEGDFPVILLDAQGKKIAESYATAQGEWMTENFVEYGGTINFKDSFSGQRGTLVLKKDNPTGLAQFDDALEIPISFE